MDKADLITKYEHRLTLKNDSKNTLRAYLNGLHIFLDYVRANQISSVTPKVLERYFHHCKKELEYCYSISERRIKPNRKFEAVNRVSKIPILVVIG
jgi:site-specific recombinase XerD